MRAREDPGVARRSRGGSRDRSDQRTQRQIQGSRRKRTCVWYPGARCAQGATRGTARTGCIKAECTQGGSGDAGCTQAPLRGLKVHWESEGNVWADPGSDFPGQNRPLQPHPTFLLI